LTSAYFAYLVPERIASEALHALSSESRPRLANT